jgi:hypothetical protein
MKLPLEGRWLALIALIAAGFFAALLVLVRFIQLPATTPSQAMPTPTGIGIARVDPVVGGSTARTDEALLDPDPLFLPTPYNASQPRLPASIRREPGAASQPVPAKYVFDDQQAGLTFPETVSIPANPVESLTYGKAQNAYDVAGRFAREEKPLPARLATVEVLKAKSGQETLTADIAPADIPQAVILADWEPFELLAAVDVTGIVGLPVVVRSSKFEAVDSFFRSYLAREFHLGERVPPGFYRLRVGP